VIAASGGKPTTVLELEPDRWSHRARSREEKTENGNSAVEGATRIKRAAGADAVADEAQKGYDLLVVGIGSTRGPRGGFGAEITNIAGGFEGPLAVALAGGGLERGNEPIRRVLIPVSGTEVSRRAAEVGFALARSGGSRVSALYVASGRSDGERRGRIRRGAVMRRNEEAVLKDIAELAGRYDARLRTALRIDVAPDEAIIKEAERGNYDLIVLGVTRRPGETLFFGNTAAAVLDRCDTAILFVAS
jgi:nucleotide-binding universal stress UspA family protein